MDALNVRDLLAEDMQDTAFRERWERTALARAVAIWLLKYRSAHQLTQTDLARRLTVRQPQIARWEAGEHEISFETLLRFSDVLGLTITLEITPPNQSGNEQDQSERVVERMTTTRGGQVKVYAA